MKLDKDYDEESFEDQQLRAECRKKWENEPNLRKEFRDKFGTYFAFEKNKHHSKIFISGKG